jgi:AcrR family transcriptional regulator
MATHAKHLPADERKNTTIEAVVALAATQNPSDITTGAIAKYMNLTQGALFRHFPTKEAIWQAVMEWASERLLAQIDQARDAANSPLAALEAMFLGHIDFIARHPGVPRMMFGQLQSPHASLPKKMATGLMHGYAERVQAVLQQGQKNGQIAPDIDLAAAATLFIGSIQGLVMQALMHGDVKAMQAVAPDVFALLKRALTGPG